MDQHTEKSQKLHVHIPQVDNQHNDSHRIYLIFRETHFQKREIPHQDERTRTICCRGAARWIPCTHYHNLPSKNAPFVLQGGCEKQFPSLHSKISLPSCAKPAKNKFNKSVDDHLGKNHGKPSAKKPTNIIWAKTIEKPSK